MAIDARKNFCKSTFEGASGINAAATEVTVADASNFPAPASGNYNLVIWNITDYANPSDAFANSAAEIVRATGLSTNTFTITRAQESTTARAFNTVGKTYAVAMTLTAKTVTDIETDLAGKMSITPTTIELGHASDTTLSRSAAGTLAVEGVDVVTTSATQTLTNKTLTSPTLTTPALGTPSALVLTNATGLPTAGLVDDAVTLAKMAAGTAGNLITYDASGNPAAVATGTATHVLTSNGAGAAPTFQAAAGGGGAWTSIAHSTFSAQTSITLSSLDGDTHRMYKLIFKAKTDDDSNLNPVIKINNDTGTNYAETRIYADTSAGPTKSGGTDLAQLRLYAASKQATFAEVDIYCDTSLPLWKGQTTNFDTSSGDGASPEIVTIGGIYNSATNITSLVLAFANASSGEYWLLRPS